MCYPLLQAPSIRPAQAPPPRPQVSPVILTPCLFLEESHPLGEGRCRCQAHGELFAWNLPRLNGGGAMNSPWAYQVLASEPVSSLGMCWFRSVFSVLALASRESICLEDWFILYHNIVI